MRRDVPKPALGLETIAGEDLDGDQFSVNRMIIWAGRGGDQVRQASQDTKSTADPRHQKACVCFMERKITDLVVGKDLFQCPIEDRMPVQAGGLIGLTFEP